MASESYNSQWNSTDNSQWDLADNRRWDSTENSTMAWESYNSQWESTDYYSRWDSTDYYSQWESDPDYSQRESDPEPRPLLQEVLCCFSIKQYKNPHLEIGDKIILPPSSFSQILNTRIEYPLIFKLQSFKSDATTSYCGVLEFDAEEGNVYLPDWMMRNLGIEEGESIVVSDASASKGVFMKLQPHKTAFTELANPRAVLERAFRDFTCLGRGSTIMIKHNQVDFYFDVLEVNPGDVISLIDTDCEVEFATPLDYVEPKSNGGGLIKKRERDEDEENDGKRFRPFMGKGRRLDGNMAAAVAVDELSKVVVEAKTKSGKEEGKVAFKPFMGKSRVLGGPLF